MLALGRIFRKTAGRFPVFIFEAFDEVGRAAEAGLEGNFSYRPALLPEQIGGALQTDGLNELIGGLIDQRAKFPVELGPAHANFRGKDFHAELLIIHSAFHNAQRILQELLIDGIDRDFLRL